MLLPIYIGVFGHCIHPGIVLGWGGRMLLPMSEYSGIPDILYPSRDSSRMGWTYATPYVGVFGDS